MLKQILTSMASAAVICGAASAAYAAEADIVKLTHQNIAGSQTCYSGDDLIETEITEIPEVYFGMRINKPVFGVYVRITAETAEDVTITTEQYNAKGKLLDTDIQTINAAAGENEYSVKLDHVRNAASLKVYADGEYIGGIDNSGQVLTLTEYPADYEIYQRGADNTAAVTFAGHISDPRTIPPWATQIAVWSDGTVFACVDSGNLYAARYDENGVLSSLEKTVLTDGSAQLENPELGMKLYIWDDDMKPLYDVWEVTSYAPDNEYVPITVTVDGTQYTTYPDDDGNFSLEITLEPGLYDASLEYAAADEPINMEFKQFGVGDIWVAAGQSNMTDMGALTSGYDYESEDPIPEGVHIIYPEDVTWQRMTHPAGEGRFFKTGIRTSPVTSFARELNEATGVPIGIVQSSVGGTNIYQWAEGVRPGDENDGYLGNALKACFDNKASTDIKGIIWYQGCNDTMNENYAYNYESLCETLFAQFRAFFGENTPIITTQINDANQDSTASLGYYDAWSYVKDVQRRYPETHENVYVTGTGAYDLGDTIHNSAKSNLQVGGAWAKTALNKVYGMTDVVCEHPTVDSVTVTGDNEITIVFKNVGAEGLYLREDNKYLGITNGLVTIPLGDLKKEFTVRMGGSASLTASNSGKGTELEITSAELVNGNTVVLTTDEALNGNIAVDCCYGKRFVPTLTDKATGWSVLAFYNVMAQYPDASEPQSPVEFAATDTAYIYQYDDAASDEKMYLNYYKDAVGYPVMKFDLSGIDKEHIQSASLNIYTNDINKDRTGT
ncbi:MAG: sialate O-acetylesterase, partial [Candidatus Ornithomonoglobus sp.]